MGTNCVSFFLLLAKTSGHCLLKKKKKVGSSYFCFVFLVDRPSPFHMIYAASLQSLANRAKSRCFVGGIMSCVYCVHHSRATASNKEDIHVFFLLFLLFFFFIQSAAPHIVTREKFILYCNLHLKIKRKVGQNQEKSCSNSFALYIFAFLFTFSIKLR
jgi:hypothetical protein